MPDCSPRPIARAKSLPCSHTRSATRCAVTSPSRSRARRCLTTSHAWPSGRTLLSGSTSPPDSASPPATGREAERAMVMVVLCHAPATILAKRSRSSPCPRYRGRDPGPGRAVFVSPADAGARRDDPPGHRRRAPAAGPIRDSARLDARYMVLGDATPPAAFPRGASVPEHLLTRPVANAHK